MRVLVTTIAPGLEAAIEPRFWRTAFLTIVDTVTMEWDAVPAPTAQTIPTAGTLISLLATHQNIQAAISNDFGPNCYIVLEAAGIPAYLSGACKTALEAVEQFKAGQLKTIYAPTSAGVQESTPG